MPSQVATGEFTVPSGSTPQSRRRSARRSATVGRAVSPWVEVKNRYGVGFPIKTGPRYGDIIITTYFYVLVLGSQHIQ